MTNQNRFLSFSDEYRECVANWRFIIGTRFTILGFYLTFNAAFLFQVLSPEIENLYAKLIISLVALGTSMFILCLQIRNRELYFQCVERAKQIESNKESMQTLMVLMDDPKIIHKSSGYGLHTVGLYGLHWLGIIIWLILAFIYSFQFFSCPCLK
jgi:hypothetical protein